jgi:methionyl-tRNA synthetase
MPKFSEDLQKQLNLQNSAWEDANFNLKNRKIGKEEILINKFEEKSEEEFPLDLKVAKILSVEDHPDADKLYVVKIDLGKEKRQIVAGLKEHYSKEELENKKVIIVTNLKHVKLRGIESQGMLLAAEDEKGIVGILTVKDSKPGNEVKFNNLKNSNEQISFENFLKIEMKVKDGKVHFNNLELKADKETVTAEKLKDNARVR